MSRYKELVSTPIDTIISKAMRSTSLSSLLSDLGFSSKDGRMRRYVSGLLNEYSVVLSSSRPRHSYSVEDVRLAIEASLCISDVLKRIGLSPHGGNGGTIRKIIEEHEFDISHFNSASCFTRGKENIRAYQDVFVEQSPIPRSSLSRQVKRFNALEYRCSVCSNEGVWNGNKLALVVDHVNGISNDNRIENLRYMCPNCHSQTDTFGGRDRKSVV